MFARLVSFVKNLYDNRYMIRVMAARDMKQQFTGSYLGIFWSVIHPLMMVLTYYIIFSFVFGPKVKADNASGSYAVWLLCGLVPWFFFSGSIRRTSAALLTNKSLVTRTVFPSEIFPVITLVSNLVSHLVGLLIIFAGLWLSSGTLTPALLYLPVYFFLMCLMVLGMGWIFSSLNVFVRDVSQILDISLNLWFYYTPIFWPVNIIPEKYWLILKINPLYHIVEGYRDCILSGSRPDPYHILYLALFSGVVFVVGGLLFKRLKPAFADVL